MSHWPLTYDSHAHFSLRLQFSERVPYQNKLLTMILKCILHAYTFFVIFQMHGKFCVISKRTSMCELMEGI
jgi:hypothetical protein